MHKEARGPSVRSTAGPPSVGCRRAERREQAELAAKFRSRIPVVTLGASGIFRRWNSDSIPERSQRLKRGCCVPRFLRFERHLNVNALLTIFCYFKSRNQVYIDHTILTWFFRFRRAFNVFLRVAVVSAYDVTFIFCA